MKRKKWVQLLSAAAATVMLLTASPVFAEDGAADISPVKAVNGGSESREPAGADAVYENDAENTVTIVGNESENEGIEPVTGSSVTAGTADEAAAEEKEEQEEELIESGSDIQDIPAVCYSAHVQRIGWQEDAVSGKSTQAYAGTSGKALRVEAIRARITGDKKLGITYNTYVQHLMWTGWQSDGASAGTTGRGLRVEAIAMKLTGDDAEKYDLYYRVHVQSFGWLAWAKNGETAGTADLSRRVEAYEVALVKKGEAAPARPVSRNAAYLTVPTVTYQTHVQKIGWSQGEVSNGAQSGTMGRSLRMEAIKIHLSNTTGFSGGISYRSHVQRVGWETAWKADGETSGTEGSSLRLEAVQIRLTGEVAGYFDVYYRTHIQRFGWSGWASNGAECGSSGYGYRLEAIEIRVVPKGSGAPGSTADSFHKYKYSVRDAYPLASARLDQVGWNLKAAYDWAKNFRYISMNVPASKGARYFATFAFTNEMGDCYGKSASFYEMAKALGYDAHWVVGYVASAGGGKEEHGWVEIDNYDGGTRVFDPSFEQGIHKNGFGIVYGQKGTWKYLDYSRQNCGQN